MISAQTVQAEPASRLVEQSCGERADDRSGEEAARGGARGHPAVSGGGQCAGPGCPAPVVVLGRPPVVLAVLGVREAVRFGARSDAPSRLVPHLTVVGVDGPTAVLIIYSPPPWGATVPTAAPSEEVDGPRGGMSCAERLSEVERRGSQGPALDRRAAFRITCSGALRAGRSTLCLSERSLWVCCLRSR